MATAQTPGVSIFSSFQNEYIEYIPGNLPIIISVPHGGVLLSGETIGGVFYDDNDANLPDRTCGAIERDVNTDILARRIQDEIFAQTGGYAHIIINNLHRSKMDPNLMVSPGSCANSHAASYWSDFHNFINDASQSVEADWGKGLYIDLQGKSNVIPRIEIGYNISSSELNSSDLNVSTIIDKSTIKSLVMNNLNNLSHEELVRGTNSLGQLFKDAPGTFYNSIDPSGSETGYQGCGVNSGYRAVPSNSSFGTDNCDDTMPHGNAYYDGDSYNNRRHGSGDGTGGPMSIGGGGNIDGVMTVVNDRVRDLGAPYDAMPNTLEPFAIDFANIILDYIDIHYNNFSEFTYTETSYDITDTDPTPAITGISDGVFSSTPAGLMIDPNTGIIDVSASAVGNYTITYSVGPNDFYTSSRSIDITDDSLSVNDQESVSMKLYPNPTNGMIHIASSIQLKEVKIYNLVGQHIMTKRIENNMSSINMSEFSTGSYLMTFYSDNQSLGSKLIVKN
ncbi:MAG: T9SS type A sorting domain-containing protein [Algicola sp.]|nr:T9SS type A sorting domain-containing protein [Algicola sp.]